MNTQRISSRLKVANTDVALAIGLTLFGWIQLNWTWLLDSLDVGSRPPFPGGFGFGPRPLLTPDVWAYLLVAACFLPLALRRQDPLSVLAAVTVAEATFELMPHPPALTILGPLVALYTVGTFYGRIRVWLAGVATGLILVATSLPPVSDRLWLPEFARILSMVAFAAALGDAARTHRAYAAEADRRAAEAERSAEAEAARRVDEERLRIARDLHDLTAHSLSVIAVQSGTAAHVLQAGSPARRAFEDIRRISREALLDMRSVVGGLRQEGEPVAPLAPTPGLARLPELVRSLEETGLRVRVMAKGDATGLPQLVDASVYRILQEALTNVMRHAGPHAAASVQLNVGTDLLSVDVADDGIGGNAVTEGHGIAGMRERAHALGGTFEAGTRPEGGWRVHAELPVRREAQR